MSVIFSPEQKSNNGELKKLSDLLYHNLDERVGQARTVKKGKSTPVDQSKQRLISQNWSLTLTVVVKKKKTSTLTLILMNQVTCPLINFKGINKAF